MLPPETTATILPEPARPPSAAAMAHPAAPTAITRMRSATSLMPRATSSSETTIEPESCDSSGHIVGSTDLPPAPSTNDAVQPSKYTALPAADGNHRGARSARPGLGRVDARRRLQLAHRCRDARDETAPAERRNDRVDIREVFENLEAGSAVARDEPVVVERMHEVAGHPI